MIGIAILTLLVLLDLCVVAGWTADSRDSEYRLWPLATEPALNPIAVASARTVRRAS